ncbi:MAG: type II secretion system F family protein [Bifidobacteriaceae bacterium]|jgi:tight adherence protein C|nr:type II secretion system F family protein [Bifidobacteriaceae bacterium]
MRPLLSGVIAAALGTVLAACFLAALEVGHRRYAALTAPLTDRLKILYPAGFWLLDLVHYKYNSTFDRRRRREAAVLNGPQFAEYHFRVFYAQVVSLWLALLPLTLLGFALTGEVMVLAVGAVAMALVWAKYDGDIKKEINARSEQFIRDFPEVLSKMTLLVNAGMIVREAWSQVANSGDSAIYQEMRRAEDEMRNGVSQTDAILDFGNRSLNPKVKKFSSTLTQNLSKGSADVVDFLLTQARLNWAERKEHVKQKGAKASNRLIIPIVLMLVGILIMIVVPLMSGM